MDDEKKHNYGFVGSLEEMRQRRTNVKLVGALNLVQNEIVDMKRQLKVLQDDGQSQENYEYFVLDGSELPAMNAIEIRINEMASNGWRLIFCGAGRWYFFERVVARNDNDTMLPEHNR